MATLARHLKIKLFVVHEFLALEIRVDLDYCFFFLQFSLILRKSRLDDCKLAMKTRRLFVCFFFCLGGEGVVNWKANNLHVYFSFPCLHHIYRFGYRNAHAGLGLDHSTRFDVKAMELLYTCI